MRERVTTNPHISAQFNAELDTIKNALMQMGGKVERQIELASDALIQAASAPAEEAIAIDREINTMEVNIDEQCTRILVRRQPAASDLRLIIAITKVTTDLERIGDEASRIARAAITLVERSAPSTAEMPVSRVARHAKDILQDALDAFARLNVNDAVDVVLRHKDFKGEYQLGLAQLTAAMREQPDQIDSHLDRAWALRSLQRIGDHASNIAEQAVYLARGVDIRHQDRAALQALIE